MNPSFPALPLVVPRQQKAVSTPVKLSLCWDRLSKSTIFCSTLSQPSPLDKSTSLRPTEIIFPYTGVVASSYRTSQSVSPDTAAISQTLKQRGFEDMMHK